MSGKGQMRLGAFFNPTGHHVASWRHPRAQADAGINFQHYLDITRTAERGKFDMVFLADNLGVRQAHMEARSPQTIADMMEEWFRKDGCDGFNIMPPFLPGGLDDFVDLVIPELQRRGLFRTEYEGKTLRKNLGLKRPASRHAKSAADAVAAPPRLASGG